MLPNSINPSTAEINQSEVTSLIAIYTLPARLDDTKPNKCLDYGTSPHDVEHPIYCPHARHISDVLIVELITVINRVLFTFFEKQVLRLLLTNK